ncbi:MAG: potassium channel family protein [Candidatus Njordarchaeota archaeon]
MYKIKAPNLSLKDLLVKIKDLAEIQLDLAYTSVIYEDREAAEQAIKLEDKITEYLGYAIIRAVMAGKDIELAEKLLALIRFAGALEIISNAAADIARLTIENVSLGAFRDLLMQADEVTIRARVRRKEAEGKSVEEIENITGMRIVAIKRRKKWILNPPSELKVWREDIVYLSGPEERINCALVFISGEERSRGAINISEHMKNFFDFLISMKYIAETSLALSYYALLTGDKSLAKEVEHLEQWVDYMRDILDVYTLKMSRHFDEVDALRGFFRLIDATEEITDAAYRLSQIVLKGIDVSPIFQIILDESDEKLISLEIASGSPMAGKTIGEIDFEKNFGLFLLGIRRGKTWYFSPEDTAKLYPGDVLILRGSKSALEKFLSQMIPNSSSNE